VDALEHAVEVVDAADEIAVDVDFRGPRRDLDSQISRRVVIGVARVAIVGVWAGEVWISPESS